MEYKIEIEEIMGSGDETYVVEGATLTCTLGTIQNQLQIPDSHGIYINGIKRANVADHVGGVNIMSFGPCRRAFPPPPCIMATIMKWVKGKEDALINDEPALQNISLNLCACGGVISIVDDGQ